MRWILVQFLVVCFSGVVLSAQSLVEIISIIDKSSVISCYIKVFSVIKSSKRPQALSFRFLVLDDLDINTLASMYKGCFPDVNVHFKRWTRPSTLPALTNKGFDTEYIYSRVYLSDIFPNVSRYVYLDNDIVVNMDIAEVYHTPLVRAPHPLSTRHKRPLPPQQLHTTHSLGRSRPLTRAAGVPAPARHPSPRVAMGFVFDSNEKLNAYVKNGFNQSNPLFIKAMSYIEPAKFFNGGVALVDANMWRRTNMTARAEEILRGNWRDALYSGRGLGDQGLFFLLLQDGIAELHPAFNMRRVPNKTTRFLKDRLGIVHFAGTTHGNARAICLDPLQYPVLSIAAVPLYLSVVQAMFAACPLLLEGGEGVVPAVSAWLSVRDTCQRATEMTRKHQQEGKLQVELMHERAGVFSWPPQ